MKTITSATLCIGILLVSCASPSKDQPDPARQPWRDSWQALPAAKSGDAEGLLAFFLGEKVVHFLVACLKEGGG